MSDPFIPPARPLADDRRWAPLQAIARIDGKRAEMELHRELKRKEGDGVGLEHAAGVCTGLLVARDVLRAMIGKRVDA